MQRSDPREHFGQQLGKIARLWRAEIDRRLAPYGLTESRWRILLELSRSPLAVTQKTLASAVNVQGPTLVRTLDRLESEGLIERRASVDDRRVKTVHLTARADPKLERIQAEAEQVRAELLADIDTAELETCLGVFQDIIGKLSDRQRGGQ